MAISRWQHTIVDDEGNVVPNATITVRREITGLPLQSLFSDRDGLTPKSNPFAADSEGFAAFYAAGGAYQVTATSGAFSRTWRHCALGTAAEFDFESLLAGLDWEDAWVTATNYSTLQGVRHQGSGYICILDHTSGATSEPGVGATWQTYWSLLVERGSGEFEWVFDSTTASADPGTGEFRLNNATLASVTAMYISELSNEYGNPSLAAWIATADDSLELLRRSIVIIRNLTNRAQFAMYNVNAAITDNGTWDTLSLSHITSNGGPFVAGARYGIQIIRNADPASGLCWAFSTTTADADPGSGVFRLNNATPASVTQIYIDDNSALAATDISAWLLTWDDSTSYRKGFLRIRQDNVPGNTMIFRINSLVDGAGYVTLNVTYVTHTGVLFVNTARCSFEFSRNGDAGNAGVRQTFDASSVVMGDPGNNTFRLNNASIASVTAIAVDDLSDGVAVDTFINTWDDSSSALKGHLYIQQQDDVSKFALFAVTSITDNAGWTQLNVTYLNGAIFDTGTPCVFIFTRTGDAGNGGFRQAFSTTVTMADPGNNAFRFNNATLASVTAIAIDDLADGVSIEASVLTWDDSTSINKGYLYIQQQDDPTKFANFAIRSLVDNSGWTQVNVTYINGALPTNGALCSFRFSRTGDAGLSNFRQTYDSSSNVMGDPGNNTFRVNNAAWASVTALALDDLADSVAVDTYINTWDDSTSVIKGFLYVCQQDNPAKFAMYQVNSLVDNAGWTQVNVTYLNGAAIDNGSPVFFSFSRNGDRGSPSGLRWLFDNATAMADPGSGDFRLNNAALASVNAIALSELLSETGAPSVEAFLLTWDDSTSTIKGFITIIDVLAQQNFAVYSISALTNNTNWVQLTVAHISSNGAFTNGSQCMIHFTRNGDKGDTGATVLDFATLVTVDVVQTDDWMVIGDVSDDTPNPDETKRVAVSQFLSDRIDPVYAKITRQVNAQSGTTYTLVLADAGKLVTLTNASAITLTVPTNASVAFPVNTQIDLAQLGAGQVTISGAGVTFQSEDGKLKLSKQYSAGTLVKTATDTWLLTGSIAA